MARRQPMRRPLVVLGLCVFLTTILWFVQATSERAKIEHVVERLVGLVSSGARLHAASHVQREFESLIEPDAMVRIPELPAVGSGRKSAIDAVLQASARYESMLLELEQLTIEVDDSGREARVRAMSTLTRTGADRVLSDTRRVIIGLRQADAGWRVAFIDVMAKPNEQPEARP